DGLEPLRRREQMAIQRVQRALVEGGGLHEAVLLPLPQELRWRAPLRPPGHHAEQQRPDLRGGQAFGERLVGGIVEAGGRPGALWGTVHGLPLKYQTRLVLRAGDTISPLSRPEAFLEISDLLP